MTSGHASPASARTLARAAFCRPLGRAGSGWRLPGMGDGTGRMRMRSARLHPAKRRCPRPASWHPQSAPPADGRNAPTKVPDPVSSMDRNEAPAIRRKPPANGYSPILPPPRHVSTLPDRRPPGQPPEVALSSPIPVIVRAIAGTFPHLDLNRNRTV